MCQALEELYQDGIGQGIQQGIQALILDYLEEGFDKEKILRKLEKHFSLSEEEAEEYYTNYSEKAVA